jgi:hypothetical protein
MNAIVDIPSDGFVKLCEGRDALLMEEFLEQTEMAAQLGSEASKQSRAKSALKNSKSNGTAAKTKKLLSNLLGALAAEEVEDRV